MTEQKVTRDEVIRVINELVTTGKAPTRSNVRTVLGCGDNTMIDECCTEWLMKNMKPSRSLTAEEKQKIKEFEVWICKLPARDE